MLSHLVDDADDHGSHRRLGIVEHLTRGVAFIENKNCLAGTGANSTSEAIELSSQARDMGADEWTVFKEVTLPLITPGIVDEVSPLDGAV